MVLRLGSHCRLAFGSLGSCGHLTTQALRHLLQRQAPPSSPFLAHCTSCQHTLLQLIWYTCSERELQLRIYRRGRVRVGTRMPRMPEEPHLINREVSMSLMITSILSLTPMQPKGFVHWGSEKGESSGEKTTKYAVCRQNRGRIDELQKVPLIRHHDVV